MEKKIPEKKQGSELPLKILDSLLNDSGPKKINENQILIILDAYLDRLFSPKQKELVFKKRDGLAFTKTEREYYSRIVRKKLEAIANEEVGKIARTLMTKSGKN